MGKSKKPRPVHVPNKEIFQRINYLYQFKVEMCMSFKGLLPYQAAHLMLTTRQDNREMVRFYMQSVKTMAKRQVLRLDLSIKRTICKKCFMLLVPGITATVRLRSKREKHRVVRCLDCGLVKRFMHRDGYTLWGDNPEAWVDHEHTTDTNDAKMQPVLLDHDTMATRPLELAGRSISH